MPSKLPPIDLYLPTAGDSSSLSSSSSIYLSFSGFGSSYFSSVTDSAALGVFYRIPPKDAILPRRDERRCSPCLISSPSFFGV